MTMTDSSDSRRGFLKSSAAVTAASMLAVPALARGIESPSDRIRVGAVGMRGRGRSLVNSLRKIPNVEIAALCDVQASVLDHRANDCEKADGRRPDTYEDYRQMLDDDSLDAVLIATPDHWHALQTIWACQAGKHVYVEKVAAQRMVEGRMMVDAARKYDCIVQHGTQARSSRAVQEGIRKLQEGVIGNVYMARAIAFKYRAGGKHDFGPVPPGVNWDLWQGPAEEMPFDGLALSPRWRFVKQYGNGQIGAQGVHQLDMIRWALNLGEHPTMIQAMGGHYSRPTTEESHPTELHVSYKFERPNLMVTFETRTGYANPEAGMGTTYPWINRRDLVGAVFLGSEGYMIIPDFSNYYTFLGRKHEPGPCSDSSPPDIMNDGHLENWIHAIRSGGRGDLTAEIEEGHLSSSLCYLGNIAYETERTLQFDPKREQFPSDDEANRLLTRTYRPPYVLPDVL